MRNATEAPPSLRRRPFLVKSNADRARNPQPATSNQQPVTDNSHTDSADIHDAGPIGCLSLSVDGTIQEINRVGAQALDLDRATRRGLHFSECIHEDDRERFSAHCRKLLAAGTSQNCELRLIKKDGSRLFVRLECVPVKDDKGDITSFRAVIVDIDKLKRANISLKKALKRLSYEHRKRMRLSARLIDLLEQERLQLAMDLHDDIGQSLASAKMNAEKMLARVSGWDDQLRGRLTVLRDTVVRLMDKVKDFSNLLRPDLLDHLGLVPAIRRLFHNIMGGSNIKVHFYTANIPEKFESEKELACFRIIQECASNVLKHADAKSMYVNLIANDDRLTLSVEDDGRGFSQNSGDKGGNPDEHLGLLIMEERATCLGGTFSIDSRPGMGTHVMVEMPLERV